MKQRGGEQADGIGLGATVSLPLFPSEGNESCRKVWAEKGRTEHMFHSITLSTVLRRDNKEQRRTSPGRLLHLFK